MIVRIALLLVSIPLLAHGAEGLYHAFRSRTQAHVTCEQFRRERPASAWLRLTGCEIDYVRAGYREARGRVTELFFPLRRAGASPAEPSPLVLATRDPALLAIIEREFSGAAQRDQEAFLVMMLQVVTAMGASRDLDGVARSGLQMLRTRGTLSVLQAPLADDFVVVDFGARPRPAFFPAIEAILGALGVFLFVFVSVARGGARKAAVDRAAAPASASGGPAAAAANTDTRFRRLMLVNLPPHATAAALEDAPPLGPQAAVRSALARVLPGITFSETGAGQFNRPDHVIRLELGTTPEVWTATLDMTGDAAAAALRRLVTQTGWQIYAPALGRFLRSDDLNA